MIVKEIPFMLKDGRQALLRSPRDEDIPGMLDYLCATAGETDFVLRYPEECGRNSGTRASVRECSGS